MSDPRPGSAPVVSKDRARVERNLEQIAWLLDGMFRIPGTTWRFGLDGIVGLIPEFGDLATAIVSLYPIVMAWRAGVPKITLVRMAVNVAIDLLLGAVPVLGDVADFVWKANTRNLALMRERALAPPGERGRGKDRDALFLALLLIGIFLVMLIPIVLIAVLAIAVAWLLRGGGAS